jgi:uncharacterized protein
MNKTKNNLKKYILFVLVLALTLAAMPMSTAFAAGLTADDPPTDSAERIVRLAKVWERLQNAYERQGFRLERAENFIDNLQSRIDQSNQNGKDTAAVQAALDVFAQAIKDAHPIHQSAKGIIASHKGFDDNGNVTDRVLASETVQKLGQSLKEVRDLVGDPFKLLRDALKAFRESNRPDFPTRSTTP